MELDHTLEISHLFRSFVIENVQLTSDVEAHAVVVAIGIWRRVTDKRHSHRRVGLYVVADAVWPGVRGQRQQLVDTFSGDELRLELLLATAFQAHGHDARRTVTVGRRVHTAPRTCVTSRPVSCGTHSTLSITTGRDKTRTSTKNTRGTSRPGDLSITDGWYLSNNYRAVVSTCHVPSTPSTTTVGLTTLVRTPGDFRDDINRPWCVGDEGNGIIAILLKSLITGENMNNVIDDKQFVRELRNHHHDKVALLLSWYWTQ